MSRGQKQKTKSRTLLLLVFFSIYAMSPLEGTFQTSKSNPANLDDTMRPAVGLYVVHLLLSGMVGQEVAAAADHDDETSDHCFIKKKRAILSSKNLKILIALTVIETVARGRDRIEHQSSPRDVEIPGFRHPQNPVIRLHPGNAPPATV